MIAALYGRPCRYGRLSLESLWGLMIETECGLLRLRGEDDDGRRGADGGTSLVAQFAACFRYLASIGI
jgi:hypothetical protein